jgi:hypothetical protein
MRPLSLTDPEFSLYDREIRNFGQFFPQSDVFFGKTGGESLWILSQNLNIFKARKILYTRPLIVTDLEFRLYDQEIQSFGQFLPQIGVSR